MSDLNIESGVFIKDNAAKLEKEIFHAYIESKNHVGLKKKELEFIQNGIRSHLAYLSSSLLYTDRDIYDNAMDWAKKYLTKNSTPVQEIESILKASEIVFQRDLPASIRANVVSYMQSILSQFHQEVHSASSYLDENLNLYSQSKDYLKYLIAKDRDSAMHLIFDLLNHGIRLQDIYMQIFTPVLKETGRLWMQGEMPLAFGHYITAATELIMSQLYHHIFKIDKGTHVFIGACAFGELHEIGLRMISDLLEMDGWNTHYLGSNIDDDALIKMLIDHHADVLGISVTIAHQLDGTANVIKKIRSMDELADLKVIVGGYVFNHSKDLWKKVGADFFAADAEEAVSLIKDSV